MERLSIWLLLVGFLRFTAVYFGFFDVWALRLAVFSKLDVSKWQQDLSSLSLLINPLFFSECLHCSWCCCCSFLCCFELGSLFFLSKLLLWVCGNLVRILFGHPSEVWNVQTATDCNIIIIINISEDSSFVCLFVCFWKQWQMYMDGRLQCGPCWHVRYVFFVHSTLAIGPSTKPLSSPLCMPLATSSSNASFMEPWHPRMLQACSSLQVPADHNTYSLANVLLLF